ncbi:acylphosphatase [Methanothrix sp.]|uniref:acylphosphatase n=1 Tax=Methanothrix sp. TaxID=90426 RepID=UPI0025DD7B7C|nr:acylphosphatase [Methanothrix sp.]
MRFTAYVSGKVQEVGYRARVVDIANALGLKGMIENLKDGSVKIIAEGEDEKLKWFEDAIDIKNALIYVSSIEKSYSPASGEFNSFGKLVAKGETDTRLDTAAGYLKELISAVNKMNENLGGKMDQMNENLGGKMDQMLSKQDQMLSKQDQMLIKQDQMLSKQDELLDEVISMNENLSGKMDQMLSKQDDLIIEVKNVNRKMDRALETGIVELKSDMAEVKSALKAKGII